MLQFQFEMKSKIDSRKLYAFIVAFALSLYEVKLGLKIVNGKVRKERKKKMFFSPSYYYLSSPWIDYVCVSILAQVKTKEKTQLIVSKKKGKKKN